MISNKNIMIDFKAISPKDGVLCGNMSLTRIAEIAKNLEEAGVHAVSVVTAREHFGGSLDLLRAVTGAVKIPVLRKDFLSTEADLRETLECGARWVLFCCSTTPNIQELYHKALAIGLTPVVEVHTAAEMDIAKNLGAKIIEINNRDITILERDNGTVATTLDLIKLAPKNAFIISASGIRNHTDAERAIRAGANAVLVGTAFWKGDFKIYNRKITITEK
jgi:indole-3-glycerol phosphate synthase